MTIAADQHFPSLNRRVGRAVAAAMKARGATGRDISAWLGLSKAQVSARLNGHVPFKADELLTIGARLDVDAGLFLSDAPAFPLRAEWEVLDGDGAPTEGQVTLPFRPALHLV